MGIFNYIKEKLNPAQPIIAREEPGGNRTTSEPWTLSRAYREVECVNRCVNMTVDACAEIAYDVKDKYSGIFLASGVRKEQLHRLLNVAPNPFMDISMFRRLVFMDLLMEGHAFIHWDGTALYHLPASNMEVKMDSKQFINKFVFAGKIEYKPNQIIFLKDNAYYGTSVSASGFSRLSSALKSIKRLDKLSHFKEKFYDQGTVLGLVIETDQLLSKRHKQRYEEETTIRYNPRTGSSSVLVLDGGFKAKTVSNTGFKELGTSEDMKSLEDKVALSLGIPPLLLAGGNNANIRPNIDLWYSSSIMPLMRMMEAALEFFFGYDIKIMTDDVMALAPDRKALADYVVSLVNNGLITGNEGRAELRYAKIEPSASGAVNMDEIRIPQNVAGSATGVNGQEGGKPPADGANKE